MHLTARHVLRGGTRVGFEVDRHDPQYPLVIDPVFTFATYFGGAGDDYGLATAMDAAGNVYVSGTTSSDDFPTTAEVARADEWDDWCRVFVLKLSPDGSRVLFSTVIDRGSVEDIAVSAAGEVVLTGATSSETFPTKNAIQPRCVGCGTDAWDAFVTKLDASGAGLVYSTYLGGPGTYLGGSGPAGHSGRTVAVSSSGAVIVAGHASPQFMWWTNVPAWSAASGSGFIARLPPTGDRMEFVARVPAELNDVGLDAADTIYVTGVTADPAFPLVRLLQSGSAGGLDAILMRVSADGSALTFSTRLGGAFTDTAAALAVVPASDVIVAGWTCSDGLAIPGAFQTASASGEGPDQPCVDGFVARIDTATPALRYFSYLGGWDNDSIFTVGADGAGRAYVAGLTRSLDFPTNPALPGEDTATMFRSLDGGLSFAPPSGTDPHSTIRQFAVDSGSPLMLYAGSDLGFLRSLDGGQSWAPSADPLVAGQKIETVAADPSQAGVVYATATGPTYKVLRSTSGGTTWTPLSTPVVGQVIVDPIDPATLYVMGLFRIHRSRDGGTSWTYADAGLGLVLDLTARPGGWLYAAAKDGVYLSTTRGDSWSPLLTGVTVRRVSVSPADIWTIYALTDTGLFRGTDGGLGHWTQVWTQPSDSSRRADQMALSPVDPEVLWLAGAFGLRISRDGGRAFTKVAGIPEDLAVTAIDATSADLVLSAVSMPWWFGDAFVSVVSSDGASLDYSVRLGREFDDRFMALTVTAAGSVWIAGSSGSGSFAPTSDAPGLPIVSGIYQTPLGGADAYIARFDAVPDADGDGLPTAWEVQAGLDSTAADATGDPDGDGLTNLEEYQQGTHPRGTFARYLAEGAAGAFFHTAVNVVNPDAAATATVLVRVLKTAGAAQSEWLRIPPLTRRALVLNAVPGVAGSEFSTVVESATPVAVDRTMWWNDAAYGSHASEAVEAPRRRVVFRRRGHHGGLSAVLPGREPEPRARRRHLHLAAR